MRKLVASDRDDVEASLDGKACESPRQLGPQQPLSPFGQQVARMSGTQASPRTRPGLESDRFAPKAAPPASRLQPLRARGQDQRDPCAVVVEMHAGTVASKTRASRIKRTATEKLCMAYHGRCFSEAAVPRRNDAEQVHPRSQRRWN